MVNFAKSGPRFGKFSRHPRNPAHRAKRQAILTAEIGIPTVRPNRGSRGLERLTDRAEDAA